MKRRGLTLPEMVVSIAIMAMVTTVVITAYVAAGRIVGREIIDSSVVVGSGRVLGPLDELLRQGIDVEAQYPPTGAALVATSDQALVFSVPSLDSGGNVSDTYKDYVTVALDNSISGNTRLLMTVYPDSGLPSSRTNTQTVIATNVAAIYWRYPTVIPTDANLVTTTLRLSRGSQLAVSQQTIILNSLLRNH